MWTVRSVLGYRQEMGGGKEGERLIIREIRDQGGKRQVSDHIGALGFSRAYVAITTYTDSS